MGATPLVSVIIPTYNRSQTLPRAIDSVLRQTCNDFELIVVDDGSTDETKTVLSAYAGDGKVRLVSQAHRGSAAACNQGLQVAECCYVAIQGSDDEWLPDKLEKAVVALDSAGSRVGVFYTDMLRVLADGTSLLHKSPEVRRGSFIDENSLDFAVWGIGSQSAVIRRKCFEEVGLFDERLPRFLDLELFIRLLDHFDFLYHDEALVKWYEGKGISKDNPAAAIARLYLLEKYRLRLEEDERYLAGQYLQIALEFYFSGNVPESHRFALKSLRTCPSHPLIREKISTFFPRLKEDSANPVSVE